MKKYIELNYNNQTLRGFHHLNEGNKRVVVMLHGYTGNKTENKQLYKNLSELFEVHGIDSVRVDFTGHGESDGLFEDIRIDEFVEQGQLVIDYAKNHSYQEIYLLGFSMGGLISFNLLDNTIKKTVMISPAVALPGRLVDMFEAHIGEGVMDIGGLGLKKGFSESLDEYDILKYANDYQGDILMTIGTKDAVIPVDSVLETAGKFKNATFEIFEDCDHLYSSLTYRKRLYDLIFSFLQQ